MEFVNNIPKEEYEEFVRNSKYGHFMQSYYFGKIRESKHFIPHYVGLKDKGKLVCTALLLEKKLKFNYSYFYSPRGYVIDFHNKELVKTFTEELKKYAKACGAIFIKVDPALRLHSINPEGEVVDGVDNHDVVDYLSSIGYKHLGYNLGFEHEQPRFTFRIDLDGNWDDIYQRIHPTAKKILNKGNQYNLDIYIGDSSDITDFYQTMIETSDREGIIQSPISYYKEFYEEFNKAGLSDIYMVKANIKKVSKTFEDKIESVKEEIKVLESHTNKSKAQGKINDLNSQINKLSKDLEEVRKCKTDDVVLSSIITVKYGDIVWTVHGGNTSALMSLNGNYLCYYNIMKDAYDNGYKVMDCFGACGEANPDKSNPIFGLHSFKKRLGGEYVEFLGEFDLITNPVMYKAYKTLIPIYRKLHK
jgi:peptidoglycan pentaglycine glycine transferase (the first glycine)